MASFKPSATAPPPAAAGSQHDRFPNAGKTPAAPFTKPRERERDVFKAIAELKELVLALKTLIEDGKSEPGFDKKGTFTPAGRERLAATNKPRGRDGFMQAALQSFVQQMRTQ